MGDYIGRSIGRSQGAGWFEDEGFWRDLYPFLFNEERFELASTQLAQLLELARPAGQDVLDLCCGPGRFSIPLARAGFRVVGLDLSPYLLDIARRRARAADVETEIEWIEMDMRHFENPDRFDLVVNLWSSFGYFESQEEDLALLRQVCASLRKGGTLFIDTSGKEIVARRFQGTTSDSLEDGSRLFRSHDVGEDWTRIENDWTVIKGDRVRRYVFQMSLYSGAELRELLSRAGFVDIRLYGDFEGRDYGLWADRLIAIAKKPG